MAGFGDDAYRQTAPGQPSRGARSGRLLTAELEVKRKSAADKEFLVKSVRSSVCAGDSGGGLGKTKKGRFRLFGIVSLGAGCAQSQNPNVLLSDAVRHQQDTAITGCSPFPFLLHYRNHIMFLQLQLRLSIRARSAVANYMSVTEK